MIRNRNPRNKDGIEEAKRTDSVWWKQLMTGVERFGLTIEGIDGKARWNEILRQTINDGGFRADDAYFLREENVDDQN